MLDVHVCPDVLIVVSKSSDVLTLYTDCMLCLSGLLSPMKRELLLRLQSEIENVTDAWLSTALKSLLLIQSRSDQSLLFKKNL